MVHGAYERFRTQPSGGEKQYIGIQDAYQTVEHRFPSIVLYCMKREKNLLRHFDPDDPRLVYVSHPQNMLCYVTDFMRLMFASGACDIDGCSFIRHGINYIHHGSQIDVNMLVPNLPTDTVNTILTVILSAVADGTNNLLPPQRVTLERGLGTNTGLKIILNAAFWICIKIIAKQTPYWYEEENHKLLKYTYKSD